MNLFDDSSGIVPVSLNQDALQFPVTHPEDTQSEEDERGEVEFLPPDKVFQLIQDEQPLAPSITPLTTANPLPQSIQPLVPALTSAESLNRRLLSPTREQRTRVPGGNLIFGAGRTIGVTTDAGSLLGRSAAARDARVQKRSPVINDPRVRGNGTGSLTASGSYWVPARQDLDTMLSKLDSRLISNMIIIPGPYSTRYGPGSSFIDLDLVHSPRYENGFESHGSTVAEYQTNGQQFYGRQTFMTGDTNWGIRAGYGHRGGSDYATGNGNEIPGGYQSRDFDVEIGTDLSPDSHLEFSFLRLDQTNVEIPGAVFDLQYLITNAYEFNYVLENQDWFDRLSVEGWYNRTQFKGNTQHGDQFNQFQALQTIQLKGTTDVNSLSTGYTAATSWGQAEETQLTTGTDLRYLRQDLKELDNFTLSGNMYKNQSAPVPGSYSANPGVFTELLLPVEDRLTLKAGARADWVNTDVDGDFIGKNSLGGTFQSSKQRLTRSSYLNGLGIETTDRNFTLWAAYVTAEYQWDDNLTFLTGAGTSARPPTLTELYAYGTFLSVLQQGLTAVVGQPDLRAPRTWQVDASVQADYDQLRFGMSGFGSLVQNYITYEALNNQAPGDPNSPLSVRYINTPLASLLGGEAHVEYDQNPYLTGYGSVSYVDGRDLTRDQGGKQNGSPPYRTRFPDLPRGSISAGSHEPLPGIAPLEGRLGYRVHDAGPQSHWGLDLFARIVNQQNHVAKSLNEQVTSGFTTLNAHGFWLPTDRWKLVAGVDNLSNTYFREHLDLRSGLGPFQPGVSFFFGSELNY